ncbi:MarR family transcriptional regulator [Streptomyces sp. Li-HN-5-11]|uniref:MarR family transcriptional regulator n=1 Tax=Streptomyces sp. Li-HN-5-11 TaxID=3075432 RepID=UPI0028A95C0B|nr:MarR family transcriptional regulator [Streptomyces sp. Li-HN-5-11]WNM32004.1 MarR family transcriptional regulator [Streptomyces sp. Li-HN-5-11]WOP39223.1 MarR family transcriptional regulator [Streptomyces sp. Li-HN-5-13]
MPVALLREIAEAGPSRPGALAQRLGVVAAHVTRQVTRLEEAGCAVRVPDPDDRRARRIRLTAPGRDAVDRLRDAGAQEMRLALAA